MKFSQHAKEIVTAGIIGAVIGAAFNSYYGYASLLIQGAITGAFIVVISTIAAKLILGGFK